MHSGQDLDERRLAGTVVSDNRCRNLSGFDRYADIVNRYDRAKLLSHIADFSERCRIRRPMSAGGPVISEIYKLLQRE